MLSNQLRLYLVLTLVFLTALVPGSNVTGLNGLPLTAAEVIFFAIVAFSIWYGSWLNHRWRSLAWISVLTSLILWQIVGAIWLPVGWSVCLQRQLERETLTTNCEPSAQYPRGERSFVYRDINFEGSEFPLYFMNEAAFHYTSEDEPDRYNMPYYFSASAFLQPNSDTKLQIATNTPGTSLDLDGNFQEISVDEGVSVTLTGGALHHVQVSFTAPHNASNLLHITTDAIPYFGTFGDRIPGQLWPTAYRIIWSLLLVGLILLTLRELAAIFHTMSRQSQSDLWWVLILLGLAVVTRPLTSSVFSLIIIGLSVLLALRSQTTRQLPGAVLFSLLVLSAFFASSHYHDGDIVFLEGGDDQLTHESYARQMTRAPSVSAYLAGGEREVYYFQPGYRYVLGLTHTLFGESLWAPAFFQTFLLALALVWSGLAIWHYSRHIGLGIFALLSFMALTQFENTPVKLALTTYQEALGLPLLLISLAFTLKLWINKEISKQCLLGVGLMWGLTICVRQDLIPVALIAVGISWLMITATKQYLPQPKRFLSTLTLWLGMSLLPLLVILRNLLIAGKPAFLTSSLHPNLLNPFQTLFPRLAGASELSFIEALKTIISSYASNQQLTELGRILWTNIQSHYLTPPVIGLAGWVALFVLVVYGLILGSWKEKALTALLGLIVVLPLLFGSLFLHRSIASHSQTHLLLAFALSILFALALKHTYQKPLQQPAHFH